MDFLIHYLLGVVVQDSVLRGRSTPHSLINRNINRIADGAVSTMQVPATAHYSDCAPRRGASMELKRATLRPISLRRHSVMIPETSALTLRPYRMQKLIAA